MNSTDTAPPIAASRRAGLLQAVLEQHAVGQAGQRVVGGLVGQLRLGPPPVGDVVDGGDPAAAPARCPERARSGRVAHRMNSPVWMRNITCWGSPRCEHGLHGGEHVGPVLGVDQPLPPVTEQLIGRQVEDVDGGLVAEDHPAARVGREDAQRERLGQRVEPLGVLVGGVSLHTASSLMSRTRTTVPPPSSSSSTSALKIAASSSRHDPSA